MAAPEGKKSLGPSWRLRSTDCNAVRARRLPGPHYCLATPAWLCTARRDLDDLALSGRPPTEVRDVQVPVGTEGHRRGEHQAARDRRKRAVAVDLHHHACAGGGSAR